MAIFGGFKTLEDVVNSDFYNYTSPEGYETPSFWSGTNKYQIEASVKASNVAGKRNYAKLKNPKKARKFLDGLASKFGHESLIGGLGMFLDYFKTDKLYKVEKDGNTIKATYDLGRNSIFNTYDRKVEVAVNLEDGTVNAKLMCNELVPEKVIAKDLYKLRGALRQRYDYFVKNAAADAPAPGPADAPAPVPADAPAPGPGPAPQDGYETWAQQGMQNNYIPRLLQAAERIRQGWQATGGDPQLPIMRNLAETRAPLPNINDNVMLQAGNHNYRIPRQALDRFLAHYRAQANPETGG